MKARWEIKRLGDVLQKTETVNPHNVPDEEFEYIDVSSVSNLTFSIENTSAIKGKNAPSRARKLVKTGDVLFATVRPTLKRICIVPPELNKQVCSTGYFVLRPKANVSNSFIFYYLLTEDFMGAMEKAQKGASYPAVTDTQVKKQPIPIPPLTEQQRIVAILDEAFAGIATATENAKKNLQNTRELFSSYLQSILSSQGGGWESKQISDIADVKGGKRVPKGYKLQTEITKHPYITVSDFNDDGTVNISNVKYISTDVFEQIKRYIISKDDLYISIAGTIGKTGIVPPELDGVNLTENACKLVFKKDIDKHYILYFTKTPDFIEQAGLNTRVAAQPKLALERLKTIKVPIPSFSEQQRIVAQLDALSAETKRLEAIYQQKLDRLAELKQSILHKAFAGELSAQPSATIIPFPRKIASISPTDLQDGVMAIAYDKHKQAGKELLFGRTKSEKIVHLAEAWVGIDFERQPTQMAAGPADLGAWDNAVNHAASMDWFLFRDEGTRYTLYKRPNFQKLIDLTRKAMGDLNTKLDELIRLTLDMDREKIEVLATVFAAWNNLLLTKRPAFDEAIVTEARENWHNDKLLIDRKLFFDAIQWMKKNNILPEGKGRMVSKGRLL